MKKKLYIRPVHCDSGYQLKAIAVCTTKLPLLMDEQVIGWFDAMASGKEIRKWFSDHDDGPFVLSWGPPLKYYASAGEA